MAIRKIEHKADKGQTFTIAQIKAWIEETERAGIPADTTVTVEATVGGKLRRLTAEADNSAYVQRL